MMLRSHLLWKVYVRYTVLVIVAITVVGSLVTRKIEENSINNIQRSLYSESVLLRSLIIDIFKNVDEVNFLESRLQKHLQLLNQKLDTRVTVIRRNGVVIADSEEDPANMENHGSRPEVLAATSGEYGVATRFSNTLGMKMMYLALPVQLEGQLVGYVRTSLPLLLVEKRVKQSQSSIAFGVVFVIVTTLLLGLFFLKKLSVRLTEMTTVAESMAQGNYDQNIAISRSDEIGKLASALNQLAKSARDLEGIRRDFIANVSHELKTPITAVRGLIETIIEDEEMSDASQERFLSKIQDQSIRLSSIVADLLELSQLESGKGILEKESFNLNEVINSTVISLMQVAESSNIRVGVKLPEDPLILFGDKNSLFQVIRNLLENALKYSPKDAAVRICLYQENEKAVIEVQDWGIGIKQQDQDRIFQRFYRVDKARSRELGGTGLGLSIVKHIVLAHSGEISVESDFGLGSIFRVFLPIEK